MSEPCAFSSGHLIASLSSKSLNLFRVNFHTKKPTMPRTASPPATDRPIIVPVPTPPPESLLALLAGAVEDEVGVLLSETTTVAVDWITVGMPVSEVRSVGCALLTVAEVATGGAVVVGLAVVVVEESTEVVVEVLDEEGVVVVVVDVSEGVGGSGTRGGGSCLRAISVGARWLQPSDRRRRVKTKRNETKMKTRDRIIGGIMQLWFVPCERTDIGIYWTGL
jgi:hypothetical protein